MTPIKAIAHGVLVTLFWIKATHAQDGSISAGMPPQITPSTRIELPGRPASICGVNTTECGGLGVGTVTINVGTTRTEKSITTEWIPKNVTNLVTEIIPIPTTVSRNKKAHCEVITTTFVSTDKVSYIVETATRTDYRVTDTTVTKYETVTFTYDPVDDCVIEQTRAAPTTAPGGASSVKPPVATPVAPTDDDEEQQFPIGVAA